ncbi:hypothetical protein [Klenkia taihuensis]|uniref:Uncharacterized protein n=1 Tax=Klenkia taihuensis TaxID=1225127 RepID=A0A1I1L1M2_9ACTN|nr:hypothetical protein [Klenkia taihuensis]GHE10076.1 hypothetical protein GCM10011381_17520 [Klenkia taihuensis]SFC64313.1 hypothetical protein SAMN05661030_1532 [Klenkia taihuensis]
MNAAAGTGVRAVLAAALALLVRHRRRAYAAAAVATAANTVPDVLRQVLVWEDPDRWHALAVDVVGVATAVVAQLWVTGALLDLPRGGPARWRGALVRGTAVGWRALRRAPGTVLAGVVAGGAVSAVLTVPASVAALGADRVLGPLDTPGAGAFAVAAASDALASVVTLPFLALVLVLVGCAPVRPGDRRAPDRP